MIRTVIGAAVGAFVAMLALTAWGAWYGFVHGGPAASTPPGLHAAGASALYCAAYFWPLAMPVGAFIGGLAAFGSWLVRPRRSNIFRKSGLGS